jgi:hypothetical protein
MAVDSGGDFKEHVQDLVRAIAQLRAVRASVARQPQGALGVGPRRRQSPAGHTLGSVLLATARGALLLISIGCALFVVVMLVMLVSHEEGTTPSDMLSGGAVFTIFGCSAFALNRRLSRLGPKDPQPHAAG